MHGQFLLTQFRVLFNPAYQKEMNENRERVLVVECEIIQSGWLVWPTSSFYIRPFYNVLYWDMENDPFRLIFDVVEFDT